MFSETFILEIWNFDKWPWLWVCFVVAWKMYANKNCQIILISGVIIADYRYLCYHLNIILTSLAILRWPTRPQPIGFHYFHAWRLLYRVFYVSVVARFCFSDGRTDVRTPRVKIMTTYSTLAWWVKNRHVKIKATYGIRRWTNWQHCSLLSYIPSI